VRGVSLPRAISHRLVALLLLAGAAAAAVALNLLLLGAASAQNDPVGKLSPAKGLPAATSTPAAPPWTVRPTTGPVQDDGSDD
jgi:hypothetical protein